MAQNGGTPTKAIDVPITVVLMAIYITGAVGHMTILQLNRRRGHKFLMSGAMFGFCMSRIVTCALRIGVTVNPKNISLYIASQIFLNAGVLLAYVVSLLLSQRLLRALQPRLGWNKMLRISFKVIYVLLAVSLALTIIFVNVLFYTLDLTLRNDALWIQRASILYILCFNLVSLAMYLTAVLLPKSVEAERFGQGSPASQKLIIGFVLFLCILEAGFRTGIAFEAPRPVDHPAWYQSRPAFYILFFGVEIVIIYTLLISRFDRRFWIPNGSKQPGDYSKVVHTEKEEDVESNEPTRVASQGEVNTEKQKDMESAEPTRVASQGEVHTEKEEVAESNEPTRVASREE